MLARFISLVIPLIRGYFRHQVPRTAAQISYYLLFSLFPLLLILMGALGYFRLDVDEVLALIQRLSPIEAGLLEEYASHVLSNASPALSAAGAVMAVTASSAAFRALVRFTGEVSGMPAVQGFWLFVVSFILSALLLITIFAFLLCAVTGRWFLELLEEGLGIPVLGGIWRWLRFPTVFALGVLALTALYKVSLSQGRAWPGAVAASVALVLGTGGFSGFITMSRRYSLVYGSLAGIIILMLWFFLCSNILVTGSLLNCLLSRGNDG